MGRHTTAVFVKVGSHRTDTAVYRCEGPCAGVTLFTERAACAATAGHTVGVLHFSLNTQILCTDKHIFYYDSLFHCIPNLQNVIQMH